MKHLQLFEDFSSTPSKVQQIVKMFQEATKDFDLGIYTNWDEEKIKNAFLMIKTKPEFLAVNKAISAFGPSGYSPDLLKIYNEDPNKFDWLFEIYYACFAEADSDSLGFNIGKDETYRKEIINHLVNSKIVDLKAPLKKYSSAIPTTKVPNGDWKSLGL
jgi:hypothetical protein